MKANTGKYLIDVLFIAGASLNVLAWLLRHEYGLAVAWGGAAFYGVLNAKERTEAA